MASLYFLSAWYCSAPPPRLIRRQSASCPPLSQCCRWQASLQYLVLHLLHLFLWSWASGAAQAAQFVRIILWRGVCVTSVAARRRKRGKPVLLLLLFTRDAKSCLRVVRFAHGPKRSMGHFLGAEKNNFLCRDTDDAAMKAASMESCRFGVRRSLGGRFWSVVDMRKRLRRVRRCFYRLIPMRTGPQQCAENYHDPPKFSIQSSLESPKYRRMRRRRPPDPRPIPDNVREPISIRKK